MYYSVSEKGNLFTGLTNLCDVMLCSNVTGDGIGDDCSGDYDGDHIPDTQDVCPNNNKISRTDFRGLQTVVLDPYGDSQVDPEWIVHNQVLSMRQNVSFFSLSRVTTCTESLSRVPFA